MDITIFIAFFLLRINPNVIIIINSNVVMIIGSKYLFGMIPKLNISIPNIISDIINNIYIIL